MKNNEIKTLPNYELFKSECDFFLCNEEYPGWTGNEKYGIISSLSEAELNQKYPEIADAMRPYILLDDGFSGARNTFLRNNYKFSWRAMKLENYYPFDEETEYHHAELITEGFEDSVLLSMLTKEALKTVTDIQRKRILAYFFEQLTLAEIAESEGNGSTPQAVNNSIKAGLKKIAVFFS